MSRFNQPVETSSRQNATNQAYYAYAGKAGTRKYVKARTPKPVKRRVKKAVGRQGASPSIKVADCTAEYMKTLLNPFDAPAGACLPADLFPLPSQKVKTFIRGQCVLGTTGFGFVSTAMGAVNDVAATNATTATSVMAANTLFSAVTNLSPQNWTQLPFTNADVVTNNLAQARGVALGLRVRYTGTEAARNGILNFFEDQDHASLTNLSYDLVRAQVQTYSCRPNGAGLWDTCLYSGPVNPNEVEFRNVAILSASGGALLMCAIQGVAGDVYEYEVFQHIEYIGQRSIGKTPSHSDSQSYPKAQEAAKEHAGAKTLSTHDEPSVISSFLRKVVEAVPFVISQGANVMRAIEGDPMALLQGFASSAGYVFNQFKGTTPALTGRAPMRIAYK